ncbi:MAG: tripartite tricarboxylate transporter substrate binding protein [Burkholderiaceae bacterium]
MCESLFRIIVTLAWRISDVLPLAAQIESMRASLGVWQQTPAKTRPSEETMSQRPHCALALAASLAVTTLVASGTAHAADYPDKPVTVIVPYGAGGLTDTMARILAVALEKELKQSVAVVNKKGAAGTVGLTALSRAKPDGYTVSITPAAPLINQPHLRKLPYDIASFDYICQYAEAPLILAVTPDSPFKTLKDVFDAARANPNKLTYGTAGPGTIPHVAGVRLFGAAGVKARHVPMAGDAGAMTALLGKHVDLAMLNTATVAKKTTLRGLAIFAPARVKGLESLPTGKESGIDINLGIWVGMIAPKGLPQAVRTRLISGCERAAKSKEVLDRIASLSTTALFRGGKDFAADAKADFDGNGKIIGELNMGKK